jgi:hypothetical protein
MSKRGKSHATTKTSITQPTASFALPNVKAVMQKPLRSKNGNPADS